MTSCLLNCEKEKKQNVQIKHARDDAKVAQNSLNESAHVPNPSLNPGVRVQVESLSGESESASRENGTRVRVPSPSTINLQAPAAPVSALGLEYYSEMKIKRKA
jgi:hypothetical protein